ncbi:polysaccharide biosynthesis/export family protein [Psychrobacter lutiphocae]|uniref:polysaccharide biosynthesis/export family protein n=1 Tax=Psychrobacter lutiphocae TaxID=540500 RepID=UPI0003734ACB|nr:polysaccharide biosynthesis/export family protein [Psychrobacter lutiphocae]
MTVLHPNSLLASTTLAVLIGLTSGCTTLNSGFQAGDLPPQGTFIADNGMQFNVQPLSLANLPAAPTYAMGTTSITGQKNARVRELLGAPRGSEYRITNSDILSINLIGYPEITPPVPSTAITTATNPFASGYPVDQEGYVQFPLVGRIKASGMTVSQFTTSLRSQLQRYLKHPDPQVKVINYRGNKFFIDGEVRNPGEFSIDDAPATLYSAISLAGGVTATGDANSLTLTRNGQQYLLGLRDLQTMGISANQIYLQDGDAIHINNRNRNRIYVLGELGTIKPVEIPDQGLSLTQLLGEVQGLDLRTADAAKVYVVRDHGNASYTDIYHVNLQSVANLALANRFEMQPNDIIYVDPTGLTRWSRFIGNILPSTSAITQISRL